MTEINAGSWLLIINPTAGGGRCGRKAGLYIDACAQAGLDVKTVYTQYPGHAVMLAGEAVSAGHRRIAVMGGDGTVHEVANGLLTQNIVPPAELTFFAIPLGTANDWARHYAWSSDPATLTRAMRVCRHGLQDVGLLRCTGPDGKISESYFVNVLGLGFDGMIARQLSATDAKRMGKLSYFLAVLRGLFRYRAVDMQVKTGETGFEGRFFTVNAGITRYSGNGMQIVPHAIADDGLLAVTSIRNMPVWRILLNLYRLFAGNLASHPMVYTGQHRVCTVSSAEPVPVEADGEFKGFTPAEIRCIPGALGILISPGSP